MEQLLDFIDIGLENIERARKEIEANPDLATQKHTLQYIKEELEKISDHFQTMQENIKFGKYDDETIVEDYERTLLLGFFFANEKESYGRLEYLLSK